MGKGIAPAVRAPTSINIDRALWKEFKTECARKGRTVTEQLERLIRNHLTLHKGAAKLTT